MVIGLLIIAVVLMGLITMKVQIWEQMVINEVFGNGLYQGNDTYMGESSNMGANGYQEGYGFTGCNHKSFNS